MNNALKQIEAGEFFLIAGPCAAESEPLCLEVAEKVAALCSDPAAFKEKIFSARDKWIFNVEKSGRVGANAIAKITGSISKKDDLS